MNKKEVLEIRKQFSPANCAITRICGCYVNHEKEKITEWMDAFLSLPEEEEFKYFEMFKKTLSGSIGKNLLHMEFPLEQEREGGTQEFLLKLRNSKLKDEALVTEFYDKVIEHYVYAENYYIVLMHAVYDIPGKSNDGLMMEDASDHVYEHVLCSICPVNLSKPGLGYDMVKNSITERTRDWIVEAPMKGFLFPTFTDRDSNIHGVMYYTKKAEELQVPFIEAVLGSQIPMTAGDQKDNFNMVMEDTLGEHCDYEIIKNVHENLNQLLEENKENPEPIELMKPDVKRLLSQSGATQEQLETFEQQYDSIIGEHGTLMATNIAEPKKFQIQTSDVVIKVNPDRTDLVETKTIDGRQYLMIAIDNDIEVNGVHVKAVTEERI